MKKNYLSLGIVLIFLSITTIHSFSADSDCPRKVEVMCYGYKDAPPGTIGNIGKITREKRWVDDPEFTKGDFLQYFGGMFKSSRLLIDRKDQPEYSLTASFSKTTDPETGEPVSCLAIVLSFNGGQLCSDNRKVTWIDDRFQCIYHHYKLLIWSSRSPGHNLTAHIPLMAAQINMNTIENTMSAYEQIPISTELRKVPEWCNEPELIRQSKGIIEIVVEKFKTSQPYSEGATHLVRVIARALNGNIINGNFLAEDPKARVFTINPSQVATSSWITISYKPPSGEDNSDVITIYNSCDIYYENVVPLSETNMGSMLLEVENQCGWEGTLTKTENMEAGENESLLAALTPGGEYDISKNWNIKLKLKRTGDQKNSVLFEIDQAMLSDFKDEMDATLTKMEREGRKIEAKTSETASTAGRKLSGSECQLRLSLDKEKRTYRITGEINIQGIKIRGKDEMDIKVDPIDKDIDEDAQGTTGIEEEIDVSGSFKPDGSENIPEEIKGFKDFMKDLPPEFKKFMEDMGGKQNNILRWDFKRKPVIVRKG